MSDQIIEGMQMTDRDVIRSIVAAMFVIDFGIIQAVSSDKLTVDVRHAVLMKRRGVVLPEVVTKGIEVLWPASAEVSVQWDLAAGDTVLLVGLKDYVKTAKVSSPVTTDYGVHYNQNTMKAIPMGLYSGSSQHTVVISGSTITVDGGTKGAARQDDATTSNITLDSTFWTWLTAAAAVLAGFGVVAPTPTSLTGKINAGSSKVKVG